MAADPPGQPIDLDHELQDLLCLALDGSDTIRVRYLIQLLSMRSETDQTRTLKNTGKSD